MKTPSNIPIADQFHAFWASEKAMTFFLLVLLAAIFCLPLINDMNFPNRVAVDTFFAMLLISGILAISKNRRLVYFLALLITLAPICRAIFEREPIWMYLHAAFSISLTASFLIVILSQVISEGVVTIHRIQGAIAAYILIALIWALLYSLLEQLSPGAFRFPASATHQQIGVEDFIYFSITTLTTTGFGDISAAQSIARSLVMLEALIGQLFPAVLIARLVSLEVEYRKTNAHGDRPQTPPHATSESSIPLGADE